MPEAAVKEFALTGGIGSGKSSVSSRLAALGVEVIDADAIVRELQAPGERVFDMMVERWGSTIVTSEGVLDRGAVANIVFSDDAELQALNEIVHPAVAEETERRLNDVARRASERDVTAVVVHDIPLLVLPGGELLTSRDHTEWQGIIVVDTPIELAVDRVMTSRGMERDEVMARVEAQATSEERRAVADFVIDNSGTLEDLDAEIDRCWAWMQQTERDGGPEGLAGPSRTGGETERDGGPEGLAGPSRTGGETERDGGPEGLAGPSRTGGETERDGKQ